MTHTSLHQHAAVPSQRDMVAASLMLAPKACDRQFEGSNLPRVPARPMTPRAARAAMLNVAAAIGTAA